ncbi:PREDICTED: cytochrome P450 4C1-like [Polistes dominula]|uniref:Cytochrome P450 4C1-like n=1 Tax=Polistes dominula TaxID=743375 RepID=A0ABM1I080_POLDO|nr:PREDICTED: cytochrome P450 4C1-like [Polistes dominula]
MRQMTSRLQVHAKKSMEKFREINMVKNCPGPKAYPIIGNLNMILGDSNDISRKLIESFAKYTSPWRFWIGPQLVLAFDEPKDLKIILNKDSEFEKSQLYDFLKPYIGNGLLTAPVSIWDNHRNIINSTFNHQMFPIYTDVIVKHSIRLNEILETNNGRNIDILHYVHLYALLENDFNLQNNPKNKLQKYITE